VICGIKCNTEQKHKSSKQNIPKLIPEGLKSSKIFIHSFISNLSYDRSTASSKTSVFGKRLCRKSDNVVVAKYYTNVNNKQASLACDNENK
jgi:hypothetical protein